MYTFVNIVLPRGVDSKTISNTRFTKVHFKRIHGPIVFDGMHIGLGSAVWPPGRLAEYCAMSQPPGETFGVGGGARPAPVTSEAVAATAAAADGGLGTWQAWRPRLGKKEARFLTPAKTSATHPNERAGDGGRRGPPVVWR